MFEDVSLVEARLRQHPGHAVTDFASRDLYRSAVDDLARGCPQPTIALAGMAVELASGAVS
ncbi:hypothetical protein [Paracoccus nototheniae]|uniref:Uncharacterized protein n=1 Tax=Paracoccus nototheniae TaxID=2489002 RepID=A0ABW4DWG0_9RHOB|nr:hypothetical protein [Paracoccus nototheniae]